jgi:hypothetical protein
LHQSSCPALLPAVAATSRDGLLASYSNWGPNGAEGSGRCTADRQWLLSCCGGRTAVGCCLCPTTETEPWLCCAATQHLARLLLALAVPALLL